MLRLAGLFADRAVAAAAVLLLLALLACVFLGVVFRLVNQPLAWSDEMAQYLMVWTAFVGWILAARRRSHIRIMVVIDKLPTPLRRAAEVLIQLAVAVLGVVLLSRSFGLVERNFDVEWVSLPLSAALVYVPMPVAGVAITAQALIEIAEVLAGARRRDFEAGAAP
ncbi:TRAP-type C4-dicarboxylate transport system, small permease component [Chelatococcus sambhunathii]|uniref:TRAP transporter small permease protein n=2 Tax=Chelatococcus TaxID=28209 RepID=A0AAC9JMB7_9HYPH|nr:MULTISPECIES: TRAP transporter small permease [Chelatococcus]APF36029.1 TRAP transporter small permease protein [Chelatococcus daeguensis]CUA88650.1 TRAP-type C4-dicarboxylate transport system, small permease component [Chelatococcus sambhunathii]